MPIVKPTSTESQEVFIERCINDADMQDQYPDRTMRTNQCFINWENGEIEKCLLIDQAGRVLPVL